MTTNEKGSNSPQSEKQDKGNNFSLKSRVLSALKNGERLTAIGINKNFGFNDARKVISELRQDGYLVADYKLADGRKMYFLKPDGQIKIPFK